MYEILGDIRIFVRGGMIYEILGYIGIFVLFGLIYYFLWKLIKLEKKQS